MKKSLHYLLMANHFVFQKTLFLGVKDTGLTSGQPKVLDYLSEHDGAMQKCIAASCHIEPASLTSILNGMEKKGLIERRMLGGNRRCLYVFLTDKGKTLSDRIEGEFSLIEKKALSGFTPEEADIFQKYLLRVYENMNGQKQSDLS